VLSEPGGGGLDAAGRERFVTHLNENGITHFSLVFKEDLVAPERRLPWRAQLAISRLKKDLKQVPLFHDLDAAGLRLLRQQTLHEVLRPISRPDLLAALFFDLLVDGEYAHVVQHRLADESVTAARFLRLGVAAGEKNIDAIVRKNESADAGFC